MSPKSQSFMSGLISAIIETRTTILKEASQLSPTSQDTVFLGVWSMVDLIARGYPIRGIYKPSGLIAQGWYP